MNALTRITIAAMIATSLSAGSTAVAWADDNPTPAPSASATPTATVDPTPTTDPEPAPAWQDCIEQAFMDANACAFDGGTLTVDDITVPQGTKRDDGLITIEGEQTYTMTLTVNGPKEVGRNGEFVQGAFRYLYGTDPSIQLASDFYSSSLVDKWSDGPDYWGSSMATGNFEPIQIGQSQKIEITVRACTQAGTYRVSFPISQWYWGLLPDGTNVRPTSPILVSTKTVSAEFKILANPLNSKIASITSKSGKKGKHHRINFKVSVPGYQNNATATVYYQKKGTYSWKVVASGTVSNGDGGFAEATLHAKKGAIRKAGKYFVRIGSVNYSEGFDTAIKTIK